MKRLISVALLSVLACALMSCYEPRRPETGIEGGPDWLPKKGDSFTDEQLVASIMYVQSEIYHAADDEPTSVYAEAFKYGDDYYRSVVFAATYNNILNNLRGSLSDQCRIIESDERKAKLELGVSPEELNELYERDMSTYYYVRVYKDPYEESNGYFDYVPLSYTSMSYDFGKSPSELFDVGYNPIYDKDITYNTFDLDDNDQFVWSKGGVSMVFSKIRMHKALGLDIDISDFKDNKNWLVNLLLERMVETGEISDRSSQ